MLFFEEENKFFGICGFKRRYIDRFREDEGNRLNLNIIIC